MKKLSKTLAVFATILAPVFASGVAFADTTFCSISGTGPYSENLCKNHEGKSCTVVNNTDVKIINDNDQSAGSGSATDTDNNSGGGATSGNANNTNSTNVSGTITNGSCVTAAPVVTPTPTPVVTPSGGSGATVAPLNTVVTPVAAPQAGGAGATVLPNTAANSSLPLIAGLISSLGGIALFSRTGLNLISRIKS